MNYGNSGIPGKAGRLRYLRDGTQRPYRGGQDPEKRDGCAGRADGEGRPESGIVPQTRKRIVAFIRPCSRSGVIACRKLTWLML